MKRGKRTTMRDIGEAVGVTASTVSLVLRGSTAVSEKTRQRVLRAARDLGYRADPYVSALMVNRRKGKLPGASPVLAFATAFSTPDGWKSAGPDYLAYFEGARARAAQKGFRLEPFWLGPDGERGRRASGVFHARNINGVLLPPLPAGLAGLDLDWDFATHVALGFSLMNPSLNRVACDHFQSMILALRECRNQGLRRIGLVVTEIENRRTDYRWTAAFFIEQRNIPPKERVPPLFLKNWDGNPCSDWVAKHKPGAILVATADAAVSGLIQAGCAEPDRPKLVSLRRGDGEDNVPGIHQAPALLAATAVDFLVGAMGRGERGVPEHPNTILIDGVWRDAGNSRGNGSRQRRAITGQAFEEKRVTMKEVAARAGVDPSTVSLALRGSGAISAATKERVSRAAGQLGYRKNHYISRLMTITRTGKSAAERPVLGFVTAFPERDGWRRESPLFSQYFEGARKRAVAMGFRVKELWLRDPVWGGCFSREARKLRVRGLMFAPLPETDMEIQLDWADFCLVGFGFTLGRPAIHRVGHDNYSSMRRSVIECHRLGHRRIGLILTAKANAKAQNRWLGAWLALRREFALEALPPLLLETQREDQVMGWIRRNRPDVVLVPGLHNLHEHLREWGVRVPEELGFVSLSCLERGGWVTGIYQSGEWQGARAAEMLADLIERGEYGISSQPRTLMVDGPWNPGGSLLAK